MAKGGLLVPSPTPAAPIRGGGGGSGYWAVGYSAARSALSARSLEAYMREACNVEIEDVDRLRVANIDRFR